MRKGVRAGLLAVMVLAAACAGVARAQAVKDDSVEFVNRATKKTESIKGKVTDEGPGGIKVALRGKKDDVKAIRAEDIVYIEYDVPGFNRSAYRAPFTKEEHASKEADKAKRGKLLSEAIGGFIGLEKDLKTRNEARRYAQYKAAILTARLARDDPGRTGDAIKRLEEFTADNRTGWQILPALTALARMQEDEGQPDKARAAYEAIARLPDIDKGVVRQSEILVAKLYLRSGKADDTKEAQKRFEGLMLGLGPADPEKPFLEAGLAECKIVQGKLDGVEKLLGDALKGAGDNQLRGVLHNLLGEYHLKKGQRAEAFWHFLRVDALYNELPEEQARALYHLGALFDEVRKDPIRGRECYRRLAGKAFEGTRYHSLALKEKKGGEEK